MPAAPLADLSSIDLAAEAVSLEQFRKFVLQRGSFALIDRVPHHDLDGELIVGIKEVRGDQWWASDHIPGRPIFPGALMVEASAQLATYEFLQRRTDIQDRFIGFAGIDSTRFRGVVAPDSDLVILAKPHRLRAPLFNYRCQGFVDGKLVFESQVSGTVL